MKPNPSVVFHCLCSQNQLSASNDFTNTFICIKCKNRFHISCYDNPTIQILNNTVTCIRCRLDIIEPYWALNNKYLIQPTFLPANKPVDLTFKIDLTQEERELPAGDHKVIVFCTKLKSLVLNNFMYEWPSDKFEILLNKSGVKYNIYSYAYIDPASFNTSEKTVELRIHCKDPLSANSVIGVSLAKKVEMKEIAIEIAKKNKMTIEEAKKKYQEIRQSDLEFSMGVPIKDPITSFILYMPARGYNCEHIACFDLMSFLSFNKSNYTNLRWKCPICKTTLNSNEILIDLYLHKIVKEIRRDHMKEGEMEKFSHIYFDEKGGWKPKEKFSNLWSQNNKLPAKEKIAETGDFIDVSPVTVQKTHEKTFQNFNNVIEISEEDEEKNTSSSHTMQECLLIIKSFQNGKENKGEKTHRIVQIFKENYLLSSLSLKEFYDLLDQTHNLNKISTLEGLFINNSIKGIEDICSELDVSIGLLCKLIMIWSFNNESLSKITYMISSRNKQKPVDPFLSFEIFLVIAYHISEKPEEYKSLNPLNYKSIFELFGYYVRCYMENLKKDSSENFKKILKFFISLFPEFQSSLEISQNNEKNSHQFSLFVNTLLSKKNKDEFLDIFLSIYPCSEQKPSKIDFVVLANEFRLWGEILKKREGPLYSELELFNVIEKWNTNIYLRECIESKKFDLSQVIKT